MYGMKIKLLYRIKVSHGIMEGWEVVISETCQIFSGDRFENALEVMLELHRS